MKKQTFQLLALCQLLFFFQLSAQNLSPDEAIKNMKWRAIGPANMGGRVTDIDGIPGDPSTYYVSGADGGVFKTTNGGVTFENILFDSRTYSVGSLTIAPSDHNVLWLGSGEGDPRNSVGYGRGVFRSDDAGKTWKHLGLEKTERIKRIAVHPSNPEVACVCALGREWGPNAERGVFKTVDGGKTWKKVLYIDEDTGCSDLDFEWDNPRIMYAGMWSFRRRPWRFDDSGKSTALYRSRDGGDTWEKIGKGIPEGPLARIGVAVAQSQPNTVYMISELPDQKGSLFRSDDRGDTWKVVNKDPNINFRPFYYSDIRVDPNNPEVVYSLSGRLLKTMDGGKTFRTIAQGVHGDHQAMWIDPTNSKFILNGSDGGYQVSYDAGETFDIINNVELSQFYQIFVDNQDPYNVYGGLQDNGTWVGPSNSLLTQGIMKRHWKGLAGGDGYYAVPVPGAEHEVYANLQGGVIFHVDTRFGNVRNIHPYPKITGSAGDAIADHKYRFNWDSPITISPHDPNVVYFGANVLFKSADKGYTWEIISPDLTTNDKSKQQSSGGPIYQDNTAAEFHCTILYIDESPVEKGVIWTGTDDGNVQVTRDGGKSWTNVNKNIKGLPAFSWIGKIHASDHEGGTAFVAVDDHRSDDFKPHAYMTTDYGKTWTTISDGLPQDDYVKVVRQDPVNPNLLYCGMEHGIYASWDKGKTWKCINLNLPPVSVRDLRVQKREGDLVVGTHGRGVWILDDIRGLQDFDKAKATDVHIFPVRKATLWHRYSQLENLGQRTYVAANPEFGAYVNYMLAQKPDKNVKVEVKDSNGRLIRTIEDSTALAGVNRIIWDLRYDGPTNIRREAGSGLGFNFPSRGPLVAPGKYTATLTANGKEVSTEIEVRGDPRINLSPADYKAQTDVLIVLRDMLSNANELYNESTTTLEQLKDLQQKLRASGNMDQAVFAEIQTAIKKVEDIRGMLRRPPPAMNYRQKPQLTEELRSLMNAVDNATSKPTGSQMERSNQLKEESKEVFEAFDKLVNTEIQLINQKVLQLPQVVVKKVKP